MRIFIILSLLFFFTAPSAKAQEWLVDFEKAKEVASEKDQNIILVFQGSDWCAPCIKLDKEVWSTDEFKKYAEDHFVMLQADFPRKKKNKLESPQQQQNNLLAEKYNKQGFFPHVVVLNKEGDILGRTGYKKVSPSAYIKILNSF